MNYNTLPLSIALPNVAFIADLQVVYEKLCQLNDHRHRPGIRYSLPRLLLIAFLAKFAG